MGALLLPMAMEPNEWLVGDKTSLAGVSAIADSETTALPPVVAPTVSDAVKAPGATGAAWRVNVQLAPPAKVLHVVDCTEKIDALGPETAAEMALVGAPPEFITVSVLEAVAPTRSVPKSRGLGVRAREWTSRAISASRGAAG